MASTSYAIEKTFGWNNPLTDKVAGVLSAFGMTVQRLKAGAITHKMQVELCSGDICYLTGPSGGGKSVLLRELYEAVDDDDKIMLNSISLVSDFACVDCIDGDCLSVLKTLSRAGLSDVFCVLNSPATLSEGQKYRYRLAKALASGKRFIFADEFCSSLDRVTAAVVAHNVRKFAKNNDVVFVLASAHDDLLSDLLPEVIVVKHLAGQAEIVYKNPKH
ncbi:MAG: hypothetical protein K8R02_03105 [Anaerohalosphaeraceae bacterium]|nr:hypothetical protein [Anaerohalosphaeraceae bacterium]